MILYFHLLINLKQFSFNFMDFFLANVILKEYHKLFQNILDFIIVISANLVVVLIIYWLLLINDLKSKILFYLL